MYSKKILKPNRKFLTLFAQYVPRKTYNTCLLRNASLEKVATHQILRNMLLINLRY